MNKDDLPPLALIAGPTASGKSALALALAEATGGTVINADASQLYTDLRILTARPSLQDEARAPHRLYGTRDGADPASAAAWATQAKAEIAAAHGAGSLPILVGGTGLYLRTLIDGIAPIPDIDPEVRAVVRGLPAAEAHAALAREDARAAARLNPADIARVTRALEVIRSTGQPLTAWQATRSAGIGNTVRLGATLLLPPRDWLRGRAETRFATMLAEGAIGEVEALCSRGLDPASPVMRAIGVREIAAFLAGTLGRRDMVAGAVAATRQYAKRQATWFHHQPPPTWPRAFAQLDNQGRSSIVTKLRDRLLTR